MIHFPAGDAKLWAAVNEYFVERLSDEFNETPDEVAWSEDHAHRFPPWVWLEDEPRCHQAFPTLLLMARDGYPHELSPFYQFVAFRCLEGWLEEATRELADATDDDRPDWAAEVQKIDEWIELLFETTDFDHLEEIAVSVLGRTPYAAVLGADVAAYLDLMPSDIRERVARELETTRADTEQPDGRGDGETH